MTCHSDGGNQIREALDIIVMRSNGSLSVRSILIALVIVCVVTLMSRVIDLTFLAGHVGSSAPAPAPLYLLFFWLLCLAPLLSLISRRLTLSRNELLGIYAITVAAGTIPSHEVVGFMIPHMASVHFNATPENEWTRLFHRYLPTWLFPSSKVSLLFAEGEDLAVPWEAWLVPLIGWSLFLLLLFFVMMCINTIISRQWVRHERLSFPLVTIALELTQTDHPDARLPVIFRKRVFWLGVSIALSLQMLQTIHTFIPSVPAVPLRHLAIWNQPTTRPWSGLGRMEWNFIFWLIGIAFVVPTDVSMSCWVFHMITRLENVTAVIWKGASGPPSVYAPHFPALFYQGMGALLGLFLIVLWTGKAHWLRTFRTAFADQTGEAQSYRVAIIGGVIGFTLLCVWCVLAGMSSVTAVLFMGVFLIIAFVLARVRVETGLGILMSPLIVSEMLYTFRGTAAFQPKELTAIASLRWSYFARGTMGVQATQLEGFKLADALSVGKKRLGIAMGLAVFVALLLALYLTLTLFYDRGFTQLPIGDRSRYYIGSQVFWAYQNLVNYLTYPDAPSTGGITGILTGSGICLSLAALRYRFLWWHLHPVGYLAANSWGMHIYWSPFFMGWLAKTLLLRYGGLKTYRDTLPMFIGLIMGDILHQGVSSMISWAMV